MKRSVRPRAVPKFARARFNTEVCRNEVLQIFPYAAELFVSEGVLHFARGHKVAVGVCNAFARYHEAEAVLF